MIKCYNWFAATGSMSGALSDDDFSDISLPISATNTTKPLPSPGVTVTKHSPQELPRSPESPESKDTHTKTDELITAV